MIKYLCKIFLMVFCPFRIFIQEEDIANTDNDMENLRKMARELLSALTEEEIKELFPSLN